MYAIISKGELLALCERPRYVKQNEETGAYVEAAEAEAIGIAVGGPVGAIAGTIPFAIVGGVTGALAGNNVGHRIDKR